MCFLFAGTPMFMAPEVYVGNYGLEADMWSLGMMMYQVRVRLSESWSLKARSDFMKCEVRSADC